LRLAEGASVVVTASDPTGAKASSVEQFALKATFHGPIAGRRHRELHVGSIGVASMVSRQRGSRESLRGRQSRRQETRASSSTAYCRYSTYLMATHSKRVWSDWLCSCMRNAVGSCRRRAPGGSGRCALTHSSFRLHPSSFRRPIVRILPVTARDRRRLAPGPGRGPACRSG